MRNFVNQAFKDGQLLESVSIPWTVQDYNDALAANAKALEEGSAAATVEAIALLNERATLLGPEAMANRIDEVADAKRREFLGDLTRAFEYQSAERDAKAYAAAGFSGEVPDNVQNWADAVSLTPKAAAENILQESRLYNAALNGIRGLRLYGKHAVRNAVTPEEAIAVYMQVLAQIQAIGQ